jgi:hypothetical protein
VSRRYRRKARRTKGRFYWQAQEKASSASKLCSSCYWVTATSSLPPCPQPRTNRSVRVVCSTMSGCFDQSEASLARPRSSERPTTTPQFCDPSSLLTRRDDASIQVSADVDGLMSLPSQHVSDACWLSSSHRSESRDKTLSGESSISWAFSFIAIHV